MKPQKKMSQTIRWLKQALILSLLLNGMLIAVFFYFIVREEPYFVTFAFPPFQSTEKQEFSHLEILEQFYHFSFSQLIQKLESTTLIEHGYRERDFALAILGEKYFIDVARALDFPSPSLRTVFLEDKSIRLYAGLTDEDFQRIHHFLITEQWPFNGEGLYRILKQQEVAKNSSLVHVFLKCPEILAIQVLFSRTELPIKKGSLLALCLEVDWQLLSNFLKKQQACENFSDKARQEFLKEAIAQDSRMAAYLILVTDYHYALKQCSNEEVMNILLLTNERTAESVQFAKDIVVSIRPETLKKNAKRKVETFEENMEKETAARFEPLPKIGELRPKFRSDPPEALPAQVHVIKPGESLWTISNKYRVSIEDLMKINRLQSQNIQSGKMLKIPGK
jgi:hypothetical protein